MGNNEQPEWRSIAVTGEMPFAALQSSTALAGNF
jgi:hypothetical protein